MITLWREIFLLLQPIWSFVQWADRRIFWSLVTSISKQTNYKQLKLVSLQNFVNKMFVYLFNFARSERRTDSRTHFLPLLIIEHVQHPPDVFFLQSKVLWIWLYLVLIFLVKTRNCRYPAVDEMVKVFDRYGTNPFGICHVQIGAGALEVAEDFTVFSKQ